MANVILMIIAIAVAFSFGLYAAVNIQDQGSKNSSAPWGIEVTYKTLKIDGRWGDVAILDKLGYEIFNTSKSQFPHAAGCLRYHVPATYALPENCAAPFWVVNLDDGKQYRVYDLPNPTNWMYCDAYGNCETG